jgi:hypothetical protein
MLISASDNYMVRTARIIRRKRFGAKIHSEPILKHTTSIVQSLAR